MVTDRNTTAALTPEISSAKGSNWRSCPQIDSWWVNLPTQKKKPLVLFGKCVVHPLLPPTHLRPIGAGFIGRRQWKSPSHISAPPHCITNPLHIAVVRRFLRIERAQFPTKLSSPIDYMYICICVYLCVSNRGSPASESPQLSRSPIRHTVNCVPAGK